MSSIPVNDELNTNIFNGIHSINYKYHTTNFKSMNTIIDIICPVHGKFKQLAYNHFKGHGCKKCGIIKNSSKRSDNKKNFIIKVKKIHKNFYSYEKVVYKNRHKKIIVTCPIHGDFLISPNKHIYKRGCKKCQYMKLSVTQRLPIEILIEKANKKHNHKYIYKNIEFYNNMRDELNIICPKHGLFTQTANNHLSGKGCPRCKESKGETFIYNYLENNHIAFKREYKVGDYKYRYDFYLPIYNTLIEYHGIQHYLPVKYWGGKKFLNKCKKRDLIKIELAKRFGYNIIIIPYYNKNNIDDILKNTILFKKYRLKDLSNEIILFKNTFKNVTDFNFFHLLSGYCNNDEKIFNLYYKHKPRLLLKIKAFFELVFVNIKHLYIGTSYIKNKILIRSESE